MALLADKIIQFDIKNNNCMLNAVSKKLNLVLSMNIVVILYFVKAEFRKQKSLVQFNIIHYFMIIVFIILVKLNLIT